MRIFLKVCTGTNGHRRNLKDSGVENGGQGEQMRMRLSRRSEIKNKRKPEVEGVTCYWFSYAHLM